MNVAERNRINALSRWEKQHKTELNWIREHNNNNFLKARICGYLAGDGNISIRAEKISKKLHHEIRFFPDHKSLIRPYITAFKRTYNKVPKVRKKNRHYEIRINSKIIANDLLELCSFGLRNWAIPNFIDSKSKTEWLRAMYDSDSYVGNKYIRLKTINKKGLESVKNLLNEFDIETSKIYSYIPKNKKWNINYILDIRKIDSIKKFYKIIGFSHKLKSEKLLNLINKSNMPR